MSLLSVSLVSPSLRPPRPRLPLASAAAHLTAKLRALSFRAILRQDIAFFDEDRHSTGALTASLSDNPQKVNGLVGVTLGA